MTFDLITAGNACVDLFVPAHVPPPRGGITWVPSLNLVPGGNSLNTAVTAARLGVKTAFAGVLGDDVFGRHLRDFLAAEGVDTSLLKLLTGKTTPMTLVFNDASGERSFVHHPGTNTEYVIPEEAFRAPCRIFHFAAPELLPGLWPGGAIEAARRLREGGRTLTLDTFQVAGEESREDIARRHRPLLALMDMIVPNEEEARLVTGRDDLREVARYCHGLGVEVVAIKRGALGAALSWEGRFVEVPTAETTVIDTCGAGDSFAGGFLAGILRGLDAHQATELGCALGTLCVEYQGSLTATSVPGSLTELLDRFDFPR